MKINIIIRFLLEADMGVSTSESQEKIDIKQESYAPLEKEPNDNQNSKLILNKNN